MITERTNQDRTDQPVRVGDQFGGCHGIVGAMLVVVTGVASVPVAAGAGPARSDRTITRASRSRDDVVRDLVTRGIVPAATLDDGTQITSRALALASRSRDDVVRDLVARGIVPAATWTTARRSTADRSTGVESGVSTRP